MWATIPGNMIGQIVVLLLLLLLLAVLLWPLMAAWSSARPRRRPVAPCPPHYEEVRCPIGNNETLAGWFAPPGNGAAIVLLHDHGQNRLAVADRAEALRRAGYGVLLLDLRAHGQSDTQRFYHGAAVGDTLAAVDWLSRRIELQGRVGLMGIGLGGALALHAAARNAYIRAVAVEDPAPSTIDDLPPPHGALDRLWRAPRMRLYLSTLARLAGEARPAANRAALPLVAGRPVLFLARRPAARAATGYAYDAAPEPRQLWQAPPDTGDEAAARALTTFFDEALWVEAEATTVTAAEPATHDTAYLAPQPVAERVVAPPLAMMVAVVALTVGFIGLLIPFQLRWGAVPPRLPARWPLLGLLGFFGLLLAGMVLREVVLYVGYRWIGRAPPGTTRLAAGHAVLGPRLRCDAPISARAYRLIVVLPPLLLGVLPGVVGVISGSWALLLGGLWMIAAGSGDVAALWAMRGLPAGTPVRAHPRYPGCEVFASEGLLTKP